MVTVILAAVPAGTARAQTAAIGKLFTSGGYCSASVVSGKSIIVTAAQEPIDQQLDRRLVICAGVQQRQGAVWRV